FPLIVDSFAASFTALFSDGTTNDFFVPPRRNLLPAFSNISEKDLYWADRPAFSPVLHSWLKPGTGTLYRTYTRQSAIISHPLSNPFFICITLLVYRCHSACLPVLSITLLIYRYCYLRTALKALI